MAASLVATIVPFELAIAAHVLDMHVPDDRGRCVIDYETYPCRRHRQAEAFRRRHAEAERQRAAEARRDGLG